MKHYGWIVFAIVGLVLVAGFALVYFGGDLNTVGEAKSFGLKAQQNAVSFGVLDLNVNGVANYNLPNKKTQYVADSLVTSTSACEGYGMAKFYIGDRAGTFRTLVFDLGACGNTVVPLPDGSVVVPVRITKDSLRYIHVSN